MTEKQPPDSNGALVSESDAQRIGLPPFDAQEWLPYVEDIELNEQQKIELLQTLWWIMAAFVDLGFGVDSVQRYLPALAVPEDEQGKNTALNGITLNEALREDNEDGKG